MSAKLIIGIDESGKGDFFGPLVISSFLASDNDSDKLREIGVKDGKNLSVNRVHEIASLLKELYPYNTVVIMPKNYNRIYDRIKNLNKLLAEGHSEAITGILENNKADLAVSDKFGKAELLEDSLEKKNCPISLKQLVRGEAVIQVAAASIIARSEFISCMDKLSEAYDMELLRGASSEVDKVGRRFAAKYGVEKLSEVAKLHFKNYSRVVKPDLFV